MNPRKIDQFRFRGFHGCQCVCDLEIIPIADGRTVVIATEREDNSGTSVTNVAEHLASFVCDSFGIDPEKLVWIEHYGYPSALSPQRPREYDLVTFQRRAPEQIRWAPSVLRMHPDGWPGYFDEPAWRPMQEDDWRGLGIEPRQ
jgi:hypothetical protein